MATTTLPDLDPHALQKLRQEAPDLVILDMRSEADFQRGHLPGAQHADLYQMDFADKAVRALGERERPVVIHGYSGDANATHFAHYKLEKRGFRNVWAFSAGVEAWRAAGFEVETGDNPASHGALVPMDGIYPVDLDASTVTWAGRNLGTRHWGTLRLAEGTVTVRAERLEAVHVVVDLDSLEVVDLPPEAGQILRRHLLSDDFFEADRYPRPSFISRAVEAVADVTPGLPNYRLSGDLTIRNQTVPVGMMALVGRDSKGRFSAQAGLEIDRTAWGVLCGSGKFFKSLAMHLVADLISIEVHLIAKP